MLIYSEQTTDFDKQHAYRNPRFWSGEIEKFDEVLIVGDFPEIEKAYKEADKKVTVKELPQKAKPAAKKAKPPANPTSGDAA